MIENEKIEELYKAGLLTFEDWNDVWENIQALEKTYDIIDENIIDGFIEKGWRIDFVETCEIKDSYIGLCQYNLKRISIENSSSITTMKNTLIHEFGHFIDYTSNTPTTFFTDGTTWIDLYEDYKNTYPCREYAKSSVRETMITEITLGRMCLKAMTLSLTPMAFAAVTYSLSRATST